MTFIYLSAALLAAACFYGATPHQRMIENLQRHKSVLRLAGVTLCAISLIGAARLLGFWAGFFAAMTALMLTCVLLPYLDVWLKARGERHVG